MDELKGHIFALREDFRKGVLSEKDVLANPSSQFALWLQQGIDSQIEEVQAMTLSTVSLSGKPSSRIVYLREFKNNQFCFYTNYTSKKARELEKTPYASLTFFWKELERQVRIEGVVERASAKQSDAYYDSRPYDSKIGAWASSQSQVLSSRIELEDQVKELKARFTPETIKRPDFWGGFVLHAHYYEFWQGRESRLHDRLAYELKNTNWNIHRLAP